MFDHEDDYDAPPRPSLRDRFPEMRPLAELPTILGVAGCGLGLSGARDADPESGSWVTSHCLKLCGLPLWALAAYRVQRSPRGGIQFLGRVPLRKSAWAWNVGSLALGAFLVFLVIGLVVGNSEKEAAGKMAEAERLFQEGKPGSAAHLLRGVMQGKTKHAETAREKLIALAKDAKGDRDQMADLLRVLASSEAGGDPLHPDLFKRGYAFAESIMEKDPLGALEIHDIVAAHYVSDLGERLGLARRLLEAALKQKKNDPELSSRLGIVLDEQGHPDEAVRLLEPLADKLGPLPGAAVLGRERLRQGRWADAKKLLAPVVEARRPIYNGLSDRMQDEQEAMWKKHSDAIRARTAKGYDYAKHDAANEDERRKMLSEYVYSMWPDEHRARVATHAVDLEESTFRAVMSLGEAEIQLALAEDTTEAMRRGLSQSEATLMSIREQFEGHPLRETRVARWLYRMGKPLEAKKRLDDLLTVRKHPYRMVMMSVGVLHETGAEAEARAMLEAAYAREKAQHDKEHIAYMRAQTSTDLDDCWNWLGKAGEGDHNVKRTRQFVEISRLFREGKDDAAAKLCREGLAALKDKEDVGSLYSAARFHSLLFRIAPDKADLLALIAKTNKSAELDRSGVGIMISEADVGRTEAAMAVAEGIDWVALRQRPSERHLAYLYGDEAGRAALRKKLAAHAGEKRARMRLERLLVLMPRAGWIVSQLGAIHRADGNGAGVARLVRRAETGAVDTTDAVREAKEAQSGKNDAQGKAAIPHIVRRAEAVLEACRELKGPTHAAAAVALSEAVMQQAYHDPAVDVNRAVELAEEADAAAPSEATKSALAAALVFRGHARLRKEVPEYAARCKKLDRPLGAMLVNWVLLAGGPLAKKVGADADIKKAQEIRAEQTRKTPSVRGPRTWAFLKASHPKEAAIIAKRSIEADQTALDLLLSPQSSGAVLDRYFALAMQGKQVQAVALLEEKRRIGVPLPEAP